MALAHIMVLFKAVLADNSRVWPFDWGEMADLVYNGA